MCSTSIVFVSLRAHLSLGHIVVRETDQDTGRQYCALRQSERVSGKSIPVHLLLLLVTLKVQCDLALAAWDAGAWGADHIAGRSTSHAPHLLSPSVHEAQAS